MWLSIVHNLIILIKIAEQLTEVEMYKMWDENNTTNINKQKYMQFSI